MLLSGNIRPQSVIRRTGSGKGGDKRSVTSQFMTVGGSHAASLLVKESPKRVVMTAHLSPCSWLDRILAECLFWSLRSYRPALICEKGFCSVFIVPINTYFARLCPNAYMCLWMPIFNIAAYMHEHYLTSNFAFECSLMPLFVLPGKMDCSELRGVHPSPL